MSALVGLALSVLALGCSSQKTKESSRPKVGRVDAYVTGIAAAFYCTCERWPRTWSELSTFDGTLHTLAQRAGKPEVPRFTWSDFPDARLGSNAEEGYLTIDFGPSKKTEVENVAVPFPDCSHFDKTAYTSACPTETR